MAGPKMEEKLRLGIYPAGGKPISNNRHYEAHVFCHQDLCLTISRTGQQRSKDGSRVCNTDHLPVTPVSILSIMKGTNSVRV